VLRREGYVRQQPNVPIQAQIITGLTGNEAKEKIFEEFL
jgi:hypothetical protein